MDAEALEEAERIASEIRSIISPLVIRRSRIDLKEIPEYAEDLKQQNIQLVIPNDPVELDYDLSSLKDLYLETLDRISEDDDKKGNDGKYRFKAARYSPVLYIKEELKQELSDLLEEKTGVELNLLFGRQANVAKFMRRLLVRRFESSEHAFRMSLEYMINSSNQILKWIETKEVELSQTEDDKKKDVYAELRNVVPNKASIDYRVDVHFSEPEHERTRHGVFTNSRKTKRERNQKIVGNKGELLIFNLLCKEYGRENVFPMSEAYVELGIIEAGLDKNCGYDIAYKDSAGTEFHVEVKTGDSQSFFLSPDELKYAKDNAEIYKLFCVYNLDKDPPDYIELPRKFWKDSRYKKRDIIEKIEFRW